MRDFVFQRLDVADGFAWVRSGFPRGNVEEVFVVALYVAGADFAAFYFLVLFRVLELFSEVPAAALAAL